MRNFGKIEDTVMGIIHFANLVKKIFYGITIEEKILKKKIEKDR